jgi:hypothetical protein
MPKAALERNSFVKGLITEASPLTFPENASIDEVNFVLNRDGSRQRRLGMDYETGYALNSVVPTGAGIGSVVINTFLWKNADNNPDNTVGVVQIGRTLSFLDLTLAAPSAGTIPTITLAAGYDTASLQFVAIKGVLVCAGKAGDAFYITKDSATTYTKTDIDLRVRDIWGVQEDPVLAIDERPATLSDSHEYNLLNQGWDSNNYGPTSGVYVSNVDIMQYGKNATDDFSRSFLNKQFFGTTPAPKGKFVIDAFTRGASRETESGVTNLGTEAELGRCTAVASYAGRVFYSGVTSSITAADSSSPSYSGTIFFSRIVDALDKFGQCYQEADPTSEHISDLIATDGGTIDIPEAANIYKLIANQTSLVVLAENGVWEISGPDGVFAADDFSISQVTNVGAINADSVINAEGTIMYWSEGGIYVLTPNDVTGKLSAQNLTETTIQTFYSNIPTPARDYVKGTYDSTSKKISWLYNDEESYTGTSFQYKYNKELVFDAVLQAFYVTSIGSLDTDSPFIAGYMPVGQFLVGDVQEIVVVDNEPVVVNGESVVVTMEGRLDTASKTKYLVLKPGANYTYTLGQYKDPTFYDWRSDDEVGVDAAGYMVAGYELFDDSQRKKYAPYITTHMKRTETGFTDDGTGNLTPINPSGCLMQAQWDFANSAASGKWGSEIQIYRLTRSYIPSGIADTFDYGHVMITTKNRLRGSGRALSLKFSTQAGKDAHIYGWAYFVEGGNSV